MARRFWEISDEERGDMDLGLGGKAAIVTAASKGIGKAIAEELAGEGANVSICARSREELEEAEADIGRHGGRPDRPFRRDGCGGHAKSRGRDGPGVR